MEHEHKQSRGAVAAAEIITGGRYGDSTRYHTEYGSKTVEGLADLIDREAVAPLRNIMRDVLGWTASQDGSLEAAIDALDNIGELVRICRSGSGGLVQREVL